MRRRCWWQLTAAGGAGAAPGCTEDPLGDVTLSPLCSGGCSPGQAGGDRLMQGGCGHTNHEVPQDLSSKTSAAT